jgi:catalase
LRRLDELALAMRKMIFDPVPRLGGIESAGELLTDGRSEIY